MRTIKRAVLGLLTLPFLLSCVAQNPQSSDLPSRESENSAMADSDASDSMEPSEKDYSSCDFSVLLPSVYPGERSPINTLAVNLVYKVHPDGIDSNDYKNVRFEFEGGEVEYSSYFENPDKHLLFDPFGGRAFCFRLISGGDNITIRMIVFSYIIEKTFPLQQQKKRVKPIQGKKAYIPYDRFYLIENMPVVMKTYEEYLKACEDYETSAVAITESTFLFCHIILIARFVPQDVSESFFNGVGIDGGLLFIQFENKCSSSDHLFESDLMTTWLQIPKAEYESAYLDDFYIKGD